MLKATWEGVVIAVRAKPGSGSFHIRKGANDLIVFLKNKAEGGKANRELLWELGRLFGCEAELASGSRSRKKLVLLRGALLTEVEQRLKQL